jgi:hypothetical protein
MPKLNPVGIAVATIAFFALGAVWYGFVFSDAWMSAQNLSKEDAGSPLWMVGGFFLTIAQVVGLAIVMRWKGVTGPGDAAATAFILWALFGLPLELYDFIYLPSHSATLLAIDAGHLLAGWIVSAVILSLFK